MLEPLHYVIAPGRRPAALDHAPVFRDWELPACIAALRAAFEGRSGPRAGTRQFIRILQLLNAHPQARVERAIVDGTAAEPPGAEAIIARVEALAAAEASLHDTKKSSCDSREGSGVHVPAPDLGRFDRLLDDPHPAGPAPEADGMTC